MQDFNLIQHISDDALSAIPAAVRTVASCGAGMTCYVSHNPVTFSVAPRSAIWEL